ncbi:lipoyl(octanoyl) transferase LipB [Marinicellulosiphila megalodicopiae]|uniref:lipoyl(octanoyl) transferase LipB n=1 Tax=Marinicellulosiphila megalodicopiae TaxID=2724896 RepID=UPI003BB09405
MQQFTINRDETSQDQIWLLEHHPVFTQGQAGKPEHMLAPGDIPVVQADRGGQVTYHGPGQFVAYVMIDIKRRKIGVRELVTALEESLVQVLARYDIQAYPKPDAPGVYVNEDKIASLGLRIKKGRSYHGLALNVDMDLSPFNRINPCGYQGLNMTQMADLCEQVELSNIQLQWLEQFGRLLALPMQIVDIVESKKSVSHSGIQS